MQHLLANCYTLVTYLLTYLCSVSHNLTNRLRFIKDSPSRINMPNRQLTYSNKIANVDEVYFAGNFQNDGTLFHCFPLSKDHFRTFSSVINTEMWCDSRLPWQFSSPLTCHKPPPAQLFQDGRTALLMHLLPRSEIRPLRYRDR